MQLHGVPNGLFVCQCMDVVGGHTGGGGAAAALCAELLGALGGLQLESLLQAHDQAAALLDPASFARKRNKVLPSRFTGVLFVRDVDSCTALLFSWSTYPQYRNSSFFTKIDTQKFSRFEYY